MKLAFANVLNESSGKSFSYVDIGVIAGLLCHPQSRGWRPQSSHVGLRGW
ncbi:hypothetical protein M2432_000894 [Mycobacterium sp. OTB74]|jgi:hypothetical protein|nr:hypothetical protein [Mycobacterium sp. OTB74]